VAANQYFKLIRAVDHRSTRLDAEASLIDELRVRTLTASSTGSRFRNISAWL
jgi:hypothetical protein